MKYMIMYYTQLFYYLYQYLNKGWLVKIIECLVTMLKWHSTSQLLRHCHLDCFEIYYYSCYLSRSSANVLLFSSFLLSLWPISSLNFVRFSFHGQSRSSKSSISQNIKTGKLVKKEIFYELLIFLRTEEWSI